MYTHKKKLFEKMLFANTDSLFISFYTLLFLLSSPSNTNHHHGFFVTAQQSTETRRCPVIAGTYEEFELTATSTSLRLRRVFTDGLCTLVRSTAKGKFIIPIARVHNGRVWTRGGGVEGTNLRRPTCDDNACTFVVPAGRYRLQQRALDTSTSMKYIDIKARFYEYASFGATPELLASTDTFPQYIQKQIALPDVTSHREYYRRNANPTWLFDTPEFGMRSEQPCTTNDPYFTRSIFTSKDTTRNTVVKVQIVSNRYYQITIQDQIRAVLNRFRYYAKQNDASTLTDITGGTYLICDRTIESFRKGVFSIRLGTGQCVRLFDTMIDFAHSSVEPPINQVVELTLPSLSSSNDWRTPVAGESYTLSTERRYRSTIAAWACRRLDVPERSVRQTEYYDGGLTYAQTSDGDWLRFLPQIHMLSNTVDDPLDDGGLQSLRDGKVSFCSNVKRTIFNEASCVFTRQDSCRPGSVTANGSETGGIVCGSVGEVANDPSIGDTGIVVGAIGFKRQPDLQLPGSLETSENYGSQKSQIWTDIVLSAPDQLRQRVAWALLQIFSLPSSAIQNAHLATEAFLQYYDIFVRNAFGNYYNILHEVSYNPLTAESLTYLNGLSAFTTYKFTQQIAFADENYARELMQLFTIGLYELNTDGSLTLDDNGEPIPTYGAENIMSFARIWVGMEKQTHRSNTEVPFEVWGNKIDPLQINIDKRDFFHKLDLYGGYLGDGKPLCIDLPAQSHLRIGAKYRLLGFNPKPEYLRDPESWTSSTDIKRTTLRLGSPLYNKLCQPDANNRCTYPMLVELSDNIGCADGFHQECNIDRPRVVKAGNVYYEYVQTSCVHQAFISDAKLIQTDALNRQPMCASAQETSAGVACCDERDSNEASMVCEFPGERTTFATAESRCNSLRKHLCKYNVATYTDECPSEYISSRDESYKWTSESCDVQAEINDAGHVKVFHNTGSKVTPFALDGPNFYPVVWHSNARYPTPANSCNNGACTLNGSSCICDTVIETNKYFTSMPLSTSAVIKNLKIGFPDIEMFDNQSYIRMNVNGLTYYQPSNEGSSCCSENTIFMIEDQIRGTIFLKNVESTVRIQGTSARFRNPPHFMSFIRSDATVAEAQNEIEALLEHLFHHSNTAPFVAKNLIQRFGTSNPTPDYIEAVAKAFISGNFKYGGLSFGSGEYGDMASTIAVVLLHAEKRDEILDTDPSSGSLREPILKVMAFMRALSFHSVTALPQLLEMDDKVGQMIYDQPSVFSFFRSEYEPPQLASAQLSAPESETTSSTNVVGLLNGLIGLLDDGLVECEAGFDNTGSCGVYEASGVLKYRPSSNKSLMIDELATLLTAGRLTQSKRQIILSDLQDISNSFAAFREASKLVVMSPEFHATNRHDTQPPQLGPSTNTRNTPRSDYKAVIHIFLDGGCDSANVLVPQQSCSSRGEYDKVRGVLRLQESELLDLNGRVSGQACSRFSVHHKLPIIKELWDDSELLFSANTAVMTKPVTPDNYSQSTLTRLFAHNAMSHEVASIDPANSVVGSGTLGRLANVLQKKGYSTGRVVVDTVPTNMATSSEALSPLVSLGRKGLSSFQITDKSTLSAAEQLNNDATSGLFGSLWSESLDNSLQHTDELSHVLDQSSISDRDFTQSNFNSKLAQRFKIIAQMIGAREERGVDRDHFFVSQIGYDTHKNVKATQNELFTDLNDNLADLVRILKDEDIWDDVVIVQTSDFGRTLSTSGESGSDHGWGGHYWIAGGSVSGRKVVGEFPESLDVDHDLDIGRGRLLPTTPWDAIFNGVANWMGAQTKTELDEVLPNRYQFPSQTLFTADDLFA